MPQFYKNEYQAVKSTRDFFNKNALGRAVKPLVKGIYALAKPYVPDPRDFLLRQVRKGGTCAEVGVYRGNLSERIYRICKPAKLYLIDPWQAIADRTESKYAQPAQDERYEEVAEKFKEAIAAGRVEMVRTTSDAAASRIPDGSCDFIYIDGDHSEAQVAKDLRNYLSKVTKGGMLCGDDYHLEGVKAAVDAFIAEYGLETSHKNRQFSIRI